MRTISVMIVEDSPVASELIARALRTDPRLRIVATAGSAEEALRLVPRIAPDVISMDIMLPGMNGIEATRRIMAECPTPIVIVAADLRNTTVNRSMEALKAGALGVISKPTIESAAAYQAMARAMCNQFVALSGVKVVRQRFSDVLRTRRVRVDPTPAYRHSRLGIDIIGVGASTGGPGATATLIQGLPEDFSIPILLVQHMASEFLAGYADWLGGLTTRTVQLARNGQRALPGHIYVAPGGYHLVFLGGVMRLQPSAMPNGHVPSVDSLFYSLANGFGPNAVGVLLTGMGDDGARGLLAMRQNGAHTIAQTKETCVVYGMPGVATALGAVAEELPIGAIAPRIAAIGSDNHAAEALS